MRSQAHLTFPIRLARRSDQSLHEQIAGQVGAALEHGVLTADTRLPSTRTLADTLGVSRGVTAAAYDLLLSRGYLECRPGSGTYARRTPKSRVAGRHPAPDPAPELVDLRPGLANPGLVPLAAWRAAWREATFRPPPVGAPPVRGLPELRAAVAEHVARTQGLRLADRTVVITAGVAHGLAAVLDALGVAIDQVALEEPAPLAPARVTTTAGCPMALRTDGQGARIDELPAASRAVIVGSDAGNPLGRLMSAERRDRAVAWAGRTGGWVVDVAGDGTLSAAARRLPRLANLLPDRCVLVGGFPRSFGPALGIGYAIVPVSVCERLERRLTDGGEQPSYVAQRAAVSLLRDGTVDRLVRHVDRLAAERGDLVQSEVAAVRAVRLERDDRTGTAVLRLPRHRDAEQVAAELLHRGVRVGTLAGQHFSGRRVSPALVLGYLHPSEVELRRALAALRAEFE